MLQSALPKRRKNHLDALACEYPKTIKECAALRIEMQRPDLTSAPMHGSVER